MEHSYSLLGLIFCKWLVWHWPQWKYSWKHENEEHAFCRLCVQIIRRPIERLPLFRFYAQNLSERKEHHSIFRRGRCWLKLFRYTWEFRLEWSFFCHSSSTALGFEFADDEDDLQFHFAIRRLFSIWFTISRLPLLRKLFKDIRQGFGYDTSIKFFDNAVWIRVFYNELWGARTFDRKWIPTGINIWTAAHKEGFGFYVTVDYIDMLLGRRQYSVMNLGDPVDVLVNIHPDTTVLQRTYIARVQMHDATWKRPRWPWPLIIRRADIDCLPPIPEPGKGESD